MKLWKILLAAMVAVLMISVVAMADETTCSKDANGVHSWAWNGDTTSYAGFDDNQHIKYTYSNYVCGNCGEKKTEGPAKVTENCTWVNDGDEVKTTCTQDGYQPKMCSVCQRSGKANVTKAWGHWAEDNWSASASTSATCQVKAQYVYKCRTCGEPCKWVEYGNKADCVTKEVVTTPATCTAMGVAEVRCKWCNKLYGTTQVKAAGHTWDEVDSKASTCTTKGWVLSVCIVCGETKTEESKLAGHTWSWVDEVGANCAKDGMKGHNKCTKCGVLSVNGKDIVSAESLVLPMKAGAHIVDTLKQVTNVITDCGAYNNYQHAFCKVCGKEFDTPIAPKEHTYLAIKWDNRVQGAPENDEPTCTEAGTARFACQVCAQQKVVTIPAYGHAWSAWTYSGPADCIHDMTGTRVCTRWCGAEEVKTVAPATGHVWVDVEGTQPTCTTAGKLTRKCAVCSHTEYNKEVAALGHNYTKVIETVKPTCEAQGYTVYGCSRCDATEKKDYVAALGHNYQWEVVVKPSEAGNGKNEYTCQTCDKVADTKTVKYTKYYYNNTMTSDGPSIRELVGGNDWYRVTPVDLTVDGVYTYDLIASNKYVVGTVTIAVNAGTLTVSYKAKADVDVKDESLLIYTSKENLAAGSAVTAPVGAAINIAETFGAETQVLVSLILTGDYDAAGKTLAAN